MYQATTINKASEVYNKIRQLGHEQIIYHYDKDSGLRCIIAIHSTALCQRDNPRLFGGVRMRHYKSEQEALSDALKLSWAMTRKLAIADESYGGMKIVLYNDPEKDKTVKLMRAFGRILNSYQGWLITGVDMGLNLKDAKKMKTPYIVCRDKNAKSSGSSGENTAYGMWKSLKVCAKEVCGTSSLKGLKIAIQGLGAVGENLIPYLAGEKAKIIVSDINSKSVNAIVSKYKVTVVKPEDYYDIACDILSPCAIGGVINKQTIKRLKCKVVAGAANNVLDDEQKDSQRLLKRGILFAPDIVINGGGVMQAIVEVEGGTRADSEKKADKIPERLKNVFKQAKDEKTNTVEIINRIISKKLERR
ncbi:MAG: Glu/Leu/Phe/Val dehydrogenase dimerization domain-containing protein [Candidatus Beckwithbacteria bacterium]